MDEQRRKPLISTEGENEEPITEKPRGGCLSNVLGILGFIFIILLLFRSCGGDRKAESTPEDSRSQSELTEITGMPEDTAPTISAYEVTIILDYEEVPLTTNSPINLCVDDLVIGRQDAGTKETYTVTLDEGEHKFYLKNDGIYSTRKLTFDVSEQYTYFPFGTKTRLTFGMEIWKDFDDSDPSASIIADNSPLALEGEWVDICLARLGDYELNAILPPELYNVNKSFASTVDIQFLANDLMLNVSGDLFLHDNMIYGIYEQFGEDMEQTTDFMFEAMCEALSETAAGQCADYGLQVSAPVIENRTNGSTTWRVCTCTGSRKSDDRKIGMSNYFYMDENLRASITINYIMLDSASHSSELETFCTWVDVLQSSLELTRNTQEANLVAGSESDYVGIWEDIESRSCILEITAQPIEGYYTVDINWWAGTQYNVEWRYAGQYNKTTGGIECYQGTRTDYSPGTPSEEKYSGSGIAWLQLTNDGRLEWKNLYDDLSEEFPDMTFLFQRAST